MESSVPNKPRGIGIRPIHRIIGTILLVFTLYVGSTGLMIQAVDLRAILSHAAATDPGDVGDSRKHLRVRQL